MIDNARAIEVFLGVARNEATRGRWYSVSLALGAVVRIGGELGTAALRSLTQPDEHPDLRVLAAAALDQLDSSFASKPQPPSKE